MMRFAVLLGISMAVALAPGFAIGADDVRVARIEQAFNRWADANHVKDASLVVLADGQVAGKQQRGAYTTATAVPVASVSKLITGICVARLVESGNLSFDATMGSTLADYFSRHPAKDTDAEGITVSQLLTHSSGIVYDPSQGAALQKFKPFTKPSAERQLTAALSRKLGSRPGTSYFYNNMNYAALGLVIEAVSGQDYETTCKKTVLAPVGVTKATLNPDWRSMGAYGGWKITAEDFAKVMGYFDPGRGLLKTPFSAWPVFRLGGGAGYSLGTLMRPTSVGYNFWHFGGWSAGVGRKLSFGAYFASWGGTMGVFVDYTPSISAASEQALDSALAGAALN